MKKQQYRVFGEQEHSAAKLCTWLKKSLRDQGVCYKQKFYGISSHRCLQMTPNLFCNQRCIFCWRAWEKMPPGIEGAEKWDDPKQIVEQSIVAQRKLLSGFGGLDTVDKKKLAEANDPNQVAISLAGEPTMYPYISDLVDEYHRRNFTTFVVTNGMFPERLADMSLPTQLYLSLDAPDEQTHVKVNAPQFQGSWATLNKTLELFPSLDTRKVIRITLVSGHNDVNPEGYAKLIEKSQADFVEIKGYMFIGGSRQRLSLANMPYQEDVVEFTNAVNEHLGYKIAGDQPASRVILLSSGKKPQMIKRP